MNSVLIDDLIENSPTKISDLEGLPVYKILIVISAYISLGIGTFHFILSIPGNPYAIIFFHFIIDFIFGLGLLLSFHRIDEELLVWTVLTILFAIVLLLTGGIVGLLAGTFSLFGGIFAFIQNYDEILSSL